METPTKRHVHKSISSNSFHLRSPSLNFVRLRCIFDLYDANHDSFITVDEICLKNPRPRHRHLRFGSMIKTYIHPGNAGHTYDDFVILQKSLTPPILLIWTTNLNGDDDSLIFFNLSKKNMVFCSWGFQGSCFFLYFRFLEVNPDGKAPMIKFDDKWNPDSDVIVGLIEEKFPEPSLSSSLEFASMYSPSSRSGFPLSFVKYMICGSSGGRWVTKTLTMRFSLVQPASKEKSKLWLSRLVTKLWLQKLLY